MTNAVGMESFVELFRAIPTCVMIARPDGTPVYGNLAAIDNFGPVESMTTVADLFAPPFDAVVRDAFANVGQRLMTSRVTAGRTRIYSGYTLALDDGHQPRVAIVLHETTEQMRARREAEALARVAAATAFAGTLESTMNALADAVVSAVGSDACSVVVFDREPMRMRLIGSSGLPENYGREFDALWKDAPVVDATDAFASFNQGSVVMRGVRHAMLADPLYAPLHPHLRKATWDSMASTPLRSRGRLLGALTCYYAPGREMAEDDTTFLQAVADQAAVAVDNARLFVEAQEKAVLEERQRLARELHDSVSQALYAIGLGARTALVQLERNPAAARDPMEYVLTLAEGGLAEMRALIFELRPEDLDRDGLVAALNRHIAALRARHGLVVHDTMCEEPAGMDPGVRLALYRIAQEAVHNVTRHAQARNVHLVLTSDDEAACLEIRDDGVGFDCNGHFPGHLGLRSMRERVERLGGHFTLDSKKGEGTRIVARFPHR